MIDEDATALATAAPWTVCVEKASVMVGVAVVEAEPELVTVYVYTVVADAKVGENVPAAEKVSADSVLIVLAAVRVIFTRYVVTWSVSQDVHTVSITFAPTLIVSGPEGVPEVTLVPWTVTVA